MSVENLSNIAGLLGLITACSSYLMKDKRKFFILVNLSYVMWGSQYLLLNALNGFFVMFSCLIRNILCERAKLDNNKVAFVFIFISIGLSTYGYVGLYSLLPLLATIICTIAIARNNLQEIRFISFIACVLYVIYDICVKAYIGIIGATIEGIIALVAFIKNKETKND